MDTKITVCVPTKPQVKYEVLIGEGTITRLGRTLKKILKAHRATVVSNHDIWTWHGQELDDSLRAAGLSFDLIEVPEGEAYKSLDTLAMIYQALVEIKALRNEPIVAFGGGVIGDLAGLAAATYMRGVPFVNVPTTLLAMADSSVGGKTGVDLPAGKNLIGAFYQPSAVLADVSFLSTLPAQEYAGGMAEIIKMAALEGDEAFSALERDTAALREREPAAIIKALAKAVRFKANIVASDEMDKSGVRATLNLGHTLAHALEADAEYRDYSHGEAVATGLVFAAELSRRLGYGDDRMVERLIKMLKGFELPATAGLKSVDKIMSIMKMDKKRDERGIVFVLLDGFGKPLVEPVSSREVKEVLKGAKE
ncbi:MAG: 3-dehydroquinate synthase [Actinomycetota bacterium]